MNTFPVSKIFNSSIKKRISQHQMKCENLHIVHFFLDREPEVLGNMNAIPLELKLTLHEYKLFFLQNEYSNLLCWPTF